MAILQIQVMGVTHPHPTIGLMLDPTPAAEDTPHPLIPHHRDRVGPHIRVMGHPQQMGVHPHLAMRRPQEGITDKVIMVLDLVIHLAARNLGHPQARAGHLLPRQRPVVVGHPRAQAALLQASMDSSRRITISIRYVIFELNFLIASTSQGPKSYFVFIPMVVTFSVNVCVCCVLNLFTFYLLTPIGGIYPLFGNNMTQRRRKLLDIGCAIYIFASISVNF